MHTAPKAPRSFFRLFALLALSAAASAATTCRNPHEGPGLGRPDFEGRGHPAPLGITLARLLPPSPQRSTASFVQLINNSNQTIDTGRTRLWLQTTAGSILLAAQSWAPGTPLTVQGAALDGLDLHATAGELIVLGSALSLEAYACWGADPNTLPGGLNRLARSQGFATSWQPLPYPLADNVAINLDPDVQGAPCVAGDMAAAAPFAAADCQGGTAAGSLYLSRIQPAGIDPNGPAVEIYNPGPGALDLTGVQLCARGQCLPIVPLNQSPSVMGDTWLPGATQGLPTAAPDPARRRIVMAGGVPLSPNDLITALPGVANIDEVALLAPGRSLSEKAFVLSYARISIAPKQLPGSTLLADQMGHADAVRQWQNTTLQAPLLTGETLALKVADAQGPFSPTSWTLDASSFGTVLADGNTPFNACSAPSQPAGRAPLAIAQVTSMGDEGVVFLLNTTAESLPLADYTLAQGPNVTISLAHATLASGAPLTNLEPNALLRVAMSADMNCPEPYNICWSDPQVSLDLGELTVMHSTSPIAHLQWGTTSLTSEGGTAAAQAGIWPMPRCRMGAFTGEPDNPASLVLLPGKAGVSPADYAFGAQAVGSDIYVANP